MAWCLDASNAGPMKPEHQAIFQEYHELVRSAASLPPAPEAGRTSGQDTPSLNCRPGHLRGTRSLESDPALPVGLRRTLYSLSQQ